MNVGEFTKIRTILKNYKKGKANKKNDSLECENVVDFARQRGGNHRLGEVNGGWDGGLSFERFY